MAKRLLVVDDDEMNRDLLSRMLFRNGYEVIAAASGPETLEILDSRPVDLVLLDLRMPGTSGIGVLQRIRTKFPATVLPVIMVTALPESEGLVPAMRAGANDYITKPVDFAVALAKIETRLALASVNLDQQRAGELFLLAARASDDGLWDWDLVNRHLNLSARWKSILGYAQHEIGCEAEEWFARIHPRDRLRWRRHLEAHIQGRTAGLECELRVRHKDGCYRWVECRGGASRDASGTAIRLAGNMTDITSRKTMDAATLLPNLLWLESELEDAADEPGRAALLLLRPDGFERYRENLSPEENRGLLQAIAGRLRDSLRVMGGGRADLARAGESEFAILLRQAESEEQVRELAAGVQRSLNRVSPQGGAVFFSTSVGIALAGVAGERNSLLRDAQAALRHSREEGQGGITVFHEAMRQHDLEELRLETALRAAVERRELVVHYQPKVDLDDGSIEGFEALVRWKRPDLGLVMPNDFIPLAERNGLIVPIGKFVLERACLDTAALRRLFPAKVSVNVSGRQFSEPLLVEQVRQALGAASLEPEALRLEVTETAVMNDPNAALATMQQFRAMGVGLKLDDLALAIPRWPTCSGFRSTP
ncbi:MAG: EAL domain-containing protein [Candidatus Sulfopaludibacter sp.]|nr:EAL domain-containing protein [Candidatus Sulfopaludibacter sp.]